MNPFQYPVFRVWFGIVMTGLLAAACAGNSFAQALVIAALALLGVEVQP